MFEVVVVVVVLVVVVVVVMLIVVLVVVGGDDSGSGFGCAWMCVCERRQHWCLWVWLNRTASWYYTQCTNSRQCCLHVCCVPNTGACGSG